jgi:hypothetical protein
VAIVSQPAHGNAVANSDGSITYSASASFSGTDYFQYTISDDNGGVSLPAAFYVRVNRPVSVIVERPTAADDWTDTDGTTPVTVNVLANDTDPNGTQHLRKGSITIVGQPAHGTVTVHANGTVTYKANGSFEGMDTFSYTVRDDKGAVSLPAHVYVRVNRPTAADEWTDTDGTTPVTLSVLPNAADPDGNQHLVPGSLRIVSRPAHGVAVVHKDGTITYTANGNFSGTDSFRYTISDDNGGVSLPAAFYVRVNRPTAADQWTDADGTTPVTLSVLGNATDPDGNQHILASSVVIVSQPAHGHARANADGTITYTANLGFSGTDSFTYRLSDDNGGVSLPAGFYVRVNRPTAGNVAAQALGTVPATVDVLGQATDPDGNQHLAASSVAIVSKPAHGTAVANADGTVTYTANAGFSGTDSFRYTISDDNGGTSLPATVTLTTILPMAESNLYPVISGAGVPIDMSLLIADVVGPSAFSGGHINVVSGPAHGQVLFGSSAAQLTYKANAGYLGRDSFVYTVTGANGATSKPATISLLVTPMPVASVFAAWFIL